MGACAMFLFLFLSHVYKWELVGGVSSGLRFFCMQSKISTINVYEIAAMQSLRRIIDQTWIFTNVVGLVFVLLPLREGRWEETDIRAGTYRSLFYLANLTIFLSAIILILQQSLPKVQKASRIHVFKLQQVLGCYPRYQSKSHCFRNSILSRPGSHCTALCKRGSFDVFFLGFRTSQPPAVEMRFWLITTIGVSGWLCWVRWDWKVNRYDDVEWGWWGCFLIGREKMAFWSRHQEIVSPM